MNQLANDINKCANLWSLASVCANHFFHNNLNLMDDSFTKKNLKLRMKCNQTKYSNPIKFGIMHRVIF
jgi:hypothetical protein